MEISVDMIQGNTLARQIYSALMEQILNGEVPPRTRLKDNEVAALFGTSNTPVREALRQLALDGLVEIQPYRGCVVRQVDLGELAEIYDVRIALEPLAALAAVPKLTPEHLARMQALVEEYEAAVGADNLTQVSAAGTAFHQILVEASGNRTLIRILRELNNRIQITRRIDTIRIRLPERPSHRSLLEVFRTGDGQRAAAMIAEHIAYGKERVIKGLRAEASTPPQRVTLPGPAAPGTGVRCDAAVSDGLEG
jgi:DNA-binding GntR family transcriptional regulator